MSIKEIKTVSLSQNTQREYWLDWMKVLGMLTIVWGHSNLRIFSDFVFSFNVGLFFVISGYLTHLKTNDNKTSLKKIYNSLILPYICLSIINIIIILSWQASKESLTIETIKNAIFGHIIGLQGATINGCGCGPLWFIYTLIIIKLLCVFFKKNMIYFFSIIGFALAIYLKSINYNKDWAICNVIIALPCFSFGLILSSFKTGISKMCNKLQEKSILVSFTVFIIFLLLTFSLSKLTGFVAMFRCDYGKSAILFFISLIFGTCTIASISIKLSHISNKYITTISKGNILILAFHFQIIRFSSMTISEVTTNPFMHDGITLIIAIGIIICFIPVILFAQKHIPILIGKR